MIRSNDLDGWRGVAIACVIVGHFVPGLGFGSHWINAGRAGVELFFALSGVLIGSLLFVKQMPLDVFVVRRLSRIVPALWTFATVIYLTHDLPARTYIFDLLGLANVTKNPMVSDHLWSVALELQGYVVLAVIAAIAGRYPRRAIGLLIALVIATATAILAKALAGMDTYYGTYWRPPYRLVGMLLGACFVVVIANGHRPRLPWLLAAAMGLALQASAVPDAIKYTVGSALIAYGCATLAGGHRTSPTMLAHPTVVWMGTVSYSLYLWQQVFYAHAWFHWSIGAAAAVATGAAFHYAWDSHAHRICREALERLIQRRVPA